MPITTADVLAASNIFPAPRMRRPEFAVEPSEAAPGNAIVTIVTLTPIMNMAIYEIVDGKIAAWRDYTNSAHAKKLLGL